MRENDMSTVNKMDRTTILIQETGGGLRLVTGHTRPRVAGGGRGELSATGSAGQGVPGITSQDPGAHNTGSRARAHECSRATEHNAARHGAQYVVCDVSIYAVVENTQTWVKKNL